MRVQDKPLTGTYKVRHVVYDSTSDLLYSYNNRSYKNRMAEDIDKGWAGGTRQEFLEGCARGSTAYARRAERLVDKFANVAIQNYTQEMEYNANYGVLDYEAAMAGDPLCVYGPTIELSDKSPVVLYFDSWIASTISRREIEMRGIAMLALALSLSMYRPVQVKMVCALGFMPNRLNIIQQIDVPTAPMDLSRASWMVGSPMMPRIGLFQMVQEIAKSKQYCMLPMLGMGKLQQWQATQLGDWLAKQDGVTDYTFLPMMRHSNKHWKSEATALAWVERELARHMAEKST